MVTATFVPESVETYTLTVTLDGTGLGSVNSTPGGINCTPDCAANFEAGTVVTLTAIADAGSTLMGWEGACSGTGECVVTMDEERLVIAIFDTVSTSSFMIYLPTISKP